MKAKLHLTKGCVPPLIHSLPAENKKISIQIKSFLFIALTFIVNISFGQAPGLSKFYTSLYVVTNSGQLALADGVANVYYPTYCNDVNYQDIPKLISFNTKENISILRDGVKLAVERRVPIAQSDTSFYEISELGDKQYELAFVSQNFDPSLVAYLKDNYTGIVSNIDLDDDTTKYMFTASDAIPATKAANRFSVVFTPAGLLPVNFSSIKAFEINNNVNVEWNVENEVNVQKYNIERSTDGIHFSFVSSKDVTASQSGTKKYVWTDISTLTGTTYYRITNVNKNGTATYSKIVKVEVGNKNGVTINVYPTVMTDGVLSVQFNNAPKGAYMLRLINTTGQILFLKTISHSGGNATETIRLDKAINKGMYQLNIVGPDNKSFPSVKLLNR